jgi:hypothetical protein
VNVVGDFVENSKNIYQCYGLIGAENAKYVYYSMNHTTDSQDIVFSGLNELCYEFTYGGRGANKVLFSISCGGGCKNISYCDNCRGCSDCFGCVGLNKKQYCIFNKQYTKTEYDALVPKIIKHMNEMPYIDRTGKKYNFGEFFPTEVSPFAYNETIAFEENPISKDEILAHGYAWKDQEIKANTPTITTEGLPDSISDVNDAICDEAIACPNKGKIETQCTFAFKILADELQFYRQMKLPIPRYCPNCRYYKRLTWRNQFRFHKRKCDCVIGNHGHESKCKNEFETMYSPDRPEPIYCKECYQKEVY